MVKFKCKKCKKEHEIKHDKEHEFEEKKDKLECKKCKAVVDVPVCCKKKMYIAS